jgi:hypothetical protein
MLSLSEIDNISKFMDKDNNDGYIAISDFVTKVKNSLPTQSQSQSSFKKTERTNKWSNATHAQQTKH